MARNLTLGTLVDRCQKRGDVQSDGHVPSTEIKELVSEYFAELLMLATEDGARHIESEQTITASGASSYALNADYLSTVRVDYVLDAAGRVVELEQIGPQEEPDWLGLTGTASKFVLVNSAIKLYPKPLSGTYKHIYVPQPTDLSSAADATTVDVFNIWGERLIVWGVASVAKHKSESDQRRAMSEYNRAREEVMVWAAQLALTAMRKPIVREGEIYADPADWLYR